MFTHGKNIVLSILFGYLSNTNALLKQFPTPPRHPITRFIKDAYRLHLPDHIGLPLRAEGSSHTSLPPGSEPGAVQEMQVC